MFVHIDSDSMLYKAAAIAQKTVYICDNTKQEFGSLKEFVESGGDNYTKQVVMVGDDPLDTAVKALHCYMRSIRINIERLWPGRQYIYKTYISGQGNFRLQICPLYKANRTQTKPVLLPEVRQYFINKYAPVIKNGYEADDVCSSAHVRCQEVGVESVLVHIDKDLNTIVGTHYNPDTKVSYTITPNQAMLNFYRQLIMGDVSDNVKGIKGIGPVKAAAILPAELLGTQKDLAKTLDNIVKDYYIKAGREDDFAKNKRLLKMVTTLNVNI